MGWQQRLLFDQPAVGYQLDHSRNATPKIIFVRLNLLYMIIVTYKVKKYEKITEPHSSTYVVKYMSKSISHVDFNWKTFVDFEADVITYIKF